MTDPRTTPTNDAPVTVDDLTRPIIGIENRTAQEAFDIMADRIRSRLAALASAPALDARTAALVIAAREFWDIHNDLSDESRALDRALEPFSASVPYADQPVCSACGGNGYSGGKMPAEDKQGEYDDACEVCYGHGIASAPAAGSREAAMVTLRTDDSGRPKVWCDPEIADLIDALNTDALSTVASCSGHGHRPGIIMLTDGRCLMVFRDREYAKAAEGAYPLDINGVASAPAGDHVPDAGNMIAPAGDGVAIGPPPQKLLGGGNALMEARIRFRSDFPPPYNTPEHIAFRYNEGTWCADNLLGDLREAQAANGCLCDFVTVDVLEIDGSAPARPRAAVGEQSREGIALRLCGMVLRNNLPPEEERELQEIILALQSPPAKVEG